MTKKRKEETKERRTKREADYDFLATQLEGHQTHLEINVARKVPADGPLKR